VLDLSKIESGHTNITSASFNLSSVLFDIHSLFVLRAKSQDLDLVVNTEFPSSQFIVSDEGKIRQVLINLISNAIKYTEQGGVYVNAILSQHQDSDDRAELTIDVVDTGVGIAEADQVRVFNAFQQAEKPILKRGGTGLGLAISSQYAELLGGHLSLESELGRGSKFSFTIPVELSEGIDAAAGKQFDQVEKLDSEFLGLKVLAVDDLESNNELLERLLSPLGFDVKTATDGNTAIDLFQSWHPEIILVDRVMPGIDGLQVTQKIRALSRGKDAVIICVSASVFEGERQAVFDAGANDFLTKPFENEALLELIYKHSHIKYVHAGKTTVSGRDNLQNADDIDTIAKLPLDILERLCRVEHKESMLSMISEIADADAMLAIRLWELVENSSTSAMKEMLQRAYSQASKLQQAAQL